MPIYALFPSKVNRIWVCVLWKSSSRGSNMMPLLKIVLSSFSESRAILLVEFPHFPTWPRKYSATMNCFEQRSQRVPEAHLFSQKNFIDFDWLPFIQSCHYVPETLTFFLASVVCELFRCTDGVRHKGPTWNWCGILNPSRKAIMSPAVRAPLWGLSLEDGIRKCGIQVPSALVGSVAYHRLDVRQISGSYHCIHLNPGI